MGMGERSLTWYDGKWYEGDHPVISPTDHAAWLSSQVFDGARWFDGVMPDLDLHCQRIINSAETFGMNSPVTAAKLVELAVEGVERFASDGVALYIRPMMWAKEGSEGLIDPDPDSTMVALCIEDCPLTPPADYSLTVSPFLRPQKEMALTEAKAGCLYPNNGRIAKWARDRGFSNALSLDSDGYVAETSSTNIFAVHGDVVSTPAPTGCFLAGITRQRVIKLLREVGIEVVETSMTVEDFEKADEIFTTGNYAKVLPVTKFQDRELGTGKVSTRARELYFEYAHAHGTQDKVA